MISITNTTQSGTMGMTILRTGTNGTLSISWSPCKFYTHPPIHSSIMMRLSISSISRLSQITMFIITLLLIPTHYILRRHLQGSHAPKQIFWQPI